jgi:hypothetical protein
MKREKYTKAEKAYMSQMARFPSWINLDPERDIYPYKMEHNKFYIKKESKKDGGGYRVDSQYPGRHEYRTYYFPTRKKAVEFITVCKKGRKAIHKSTR